MRIEKANRTYSIHRALSPSSEENIIELFANDPALIKTAYAEFGDRTWVNGFLEEIYCETEIISFPEVPPPQFTDTDNNTQQLIKAADSEWRVPRAHLCLWVANSLDNANKPIWVYKGKVSLLNTYGYPNRRYRLLDYFTDNIARKLGEGSRVGVSFQWADAIDYLLLTNAEYFPDPNGTLTLSRFTLDVPAASIRVLGWRTLDGSGLPVEPTYTVSPLTNAQTRLTVSFTHELRVSPNTVKAIVEYVGQRLKLTNYDKVTIDGSWTQEIISLQPDFTPTPIVANSVAQVTRNREQTIFTVTTARQSSLSDRSSRVGGRLINRGTTNAVFYKWGGDVSTSPLIPAGQSGTTGGYHGTIAANGGTVELPPGYTGTVSTMTSAGQSQLLAEETFLVSGQ